MDRPRVIDHLPALLLVLALAAQLAVPPVGLALAEPVAEPILAWTVTDPDECGPAGERLDASIPHLLWRESAVFEHGEDGWITIEGPAARGAGDPPARRWLRTELHAARRTNVRLDIESDAFAAAALGWHAIRERASSGRRSLEAEVGPGWTTILIEVRTAGEPARLRATIGQSRRDEPIELRTDVIRRSVAAPPGAVTLIGDRPPAGWVHGDGGPGRWSWDDGVLTVEPGTGSLISREVFEDFALHLEFRTPAGIDPSVRGQARSNSGLYVFGSYEIQILDSWGEPALRDGCGALYGLRAPDVNAARPPGIWQHLDVEFTASRRDDSGAKVSDARLTVRHNGVLVHDDVHLPGPTGAGRAERPGPGPIVLQDHGDRIAFRNAWVLPHAAWDGTGGEPLIRGDGLEGWTRRGGAAVYRLEDDAIVGETRPDQPNTFLCTERTFGDFALELEFRVDPELNSGVQVRSQSLPERAGGRVHGYQVEIDPSERAWTAGIYDEARRGWLAPLEDLPAARAAFRPDGWNRLRIVARGDVLRTWINGVPAAVLADPATAEGFIGLQVHGVGGRAEPLRVHWRDLRLRRLGPGRPGHASE